MQVDFLVFHAFPEPFNKDVIDPATFAIHADLDAVALDQVDERRAGKLAALVGIEDLRLSMALNGVLDGFNAEVGRQAVG